MFDEFDKTFGGVFPSPIGELHFSMNLKSYIQFSTLSFPSPIGELHFSIMTGGTMGVEFVMFPSPIGELHFSMKLYLATKIKLVAKN